MDIVFGAIEVTLPDETTITFPPNVGPPVAGAGVEEAPADGHRYARKDAAWVQLGSTDSGGISQDDADARYLKRDERNAPGGVAGLSADPQPSIGAAQLPLPPVTLTVLFANKLA